VDSPPVSEPARSGGPADGKLDAIGFSLAVPSSWFEIDLRPSTRDASIATLVSERVSAVPELREHRATIARLLRKQARTAAEGGAVYCACMLETTEAGSLPASVTVTLAPGPLAGGDDTERFNALVDSLQVKDARTDEDTWSRVTVVDIPDVGSCARQLGIEDIDLPENAGWIRVVLMQTFVVLPDRNRVIIVSCSSPVLPLADSWFDMFDAITGTLRLV
jgi:hypothetical protein